MVHPPLEVEAKGADLDPMTLIHKFELKILNMCHCIPEMNFLGHCFQKLESSGVTRVGDTRGGN